MNAPIYIWEYNELGWCVIGKIVHGIDGDYIEYFL